ncbi:hypothetical protein HDU92_003427 [Lobulomyces angularis]|nr:hypothetical protein HDU92_003427 [Lobulomyces angularis]
MESFKPLPEDLLDTDTACKYCGISYLLLNKYEKTKLHVENLELKLSQLQEFANERPTMLSRMEILNEQQKTQSLTINDLNLQLTNNKSLLQENLKTLQNSETFYNNYKSETEIKIVNLKKNKNLLESKLNFLNKNLQKIFNQLRFERLSIDQCNKAFLLEIQNTKSSFKQVELDIKKQVEKHFILKKSESNLNLQNQINLTLDKESKKFKLIEKEKLDLNLTLNKKIDDLNLKLLQSTEITKVDIMKEKETSNNLKKEVKSMDIEILKLKDEKKLNELKLNSQKSEKLLLNEDILLKKANEQLCEKEESIKIQSELEEKIKSYQTLEKDLTQKLKSYEENLKSLKSEMLKKSLDFDELNSKYKKEKSFFELELNSAKSLSQTNLDAVQNLKTCKTSLEDEVKVLQTKLTTSVKKLQEMENLNYNQEKLQKFEMELVQSKNEIKFLKNTVRLECEERMELLSKLEFFKKNHHTQKSLETNTTTPQLTNGFAKSADVYSRPSSALNNLKVLEKALAIFGFKFLHESIDKTLNNDGFRANLGTKQ